MSFPMTQNLLTLYHIPLYLPFGPSPSSPLLSPPLCLLVLDILKLSLVLSVQKII